jgi:hypothetical protein
VVDCKSLHAEMTIDASDDFAWVGGVDFALDGFADILLRPEYLVSVSLGYRGASRLAKKLCESYYTEGAVR